MAMYQPTYMQPYSGFMQQPTMMQQMPMQPAQAQPASNSGIVWVQGEQAAKSYLVAAGNSVLLMDSDASRFYLKTADASGMPLPLRVFEYKEIQAGQPQLPQTVDYIKRDEFDQLKSMVEQIKGGMVSESSV